MMRVTLTPDPYAPLWCLTWFTTPPLYLCGYLRREDAEAKARVVAAVIHSLSTRSRAGEPRATLDALAAACVAMVAAG